MWILSPHSINSLRRKRPPFIENKPEPTMYFILCITNSPVRSLQMRKVWEVWVILPNIYSDQVMFPPPSVWACPGTQWSFAKQHRPASTVVIKRLLLWAYYYQNVCYLSSTETSGVTFDLKNSLSFKHQYWFEPLSTYFEKPSVLHSTPILTSHLSSKFIECLCVPGILPSWERVQNKID